MSEERPPAQSTVQAAGRVAEDVINGLKHQPILLAIVVLNIIGIAAALWFLNRIIDHAASFLTVLQSCLSQQQHPPARP